MEAAVAGPAGEEEAEGPAREEEVVKPTCEIQINHLVDLRPDSRDPLEERRKKCVAQAALSEWKESVEVLEGKVSRRTKRKDGLRNEIYQLVGLYSVFVGVVFSAVQSDRVQCQHIWSPIILCLLTCFIIVYAINKKFVDLGRISEDITHDERARKNLLLCLRKLKALGHSEFTFSEHAKERTSTPNEETDHESSPRPIVLSILTFSTVVLVGSFVHILCFTQRPSCEGCVNWHDYAPGRILPY